ncbi:MAG TPA: HD domain-containing protein, partial [Firmicutes bacterium]|nr:HD domain-containing protein [Bacillota bacterium]
KEDGGIVIEAIKKFGSADNTACGYEGDLGGSRQVFSVLKENKARVIDDIESCNDEILGFISGGSGSAVASPLIVKGSAEGAILIFRREKNMYRKSDIELMELMGEQVGALLHSRMLYDEMKNRAAGLEKLMNLILSVESTLDEKHIYETAIRAGISGIFEGASGIIAAANENNEIEIAASFGYRDDLSGRVLSSVGAAGWVIRNSRGLFVKDYKRLKFYDRGSDDIYLKGPSILAPVQKKGRTAGAICVTRQNRPFSKEDSYFLTILATHVGISAEAAGLYENVKKDYINTIYALAAAVDAKDHYTHGHSTTVMKYSVKIAEHLGLSAEEVETIKYAALLHDIGKIGISEAIINKPAKLTKEEYTVMKMHPQLGANIIVKIDSLRKLAPLVLAHHEWHNGNGYPLGLRGEEIPRGARIISVADAYSTMTSKRPYRDVMGNDFAVEEFKKYSGTQFEPEIAGIMVDILKSEKENIHAGEGLSEGKGGKSSKKRVRVVFEEDKKASKNKNDGLYS